VGVGYGTDIETARRVLADAVRGVEGVLPNKPVDALYNEMGDSAMIFRVRWWIESYVDKRHVIDRVNTALQEAMDAAGIDSPYPIQTVSLQVEPEMIDRLSRARGEQGGGS
jgi:small-conductance mechanosensitive channel